MDGKKFFLKSRRKTLHIRFAGEKSTGLDPFETHSKRACIMFLSAVGKSGVRAATVKILR